MSSYQRPPDIAVERAGDADLPLERESSLLPGEVRTPSFVVSVSDWAAPGSSCWEEEQTSVPSSQTPLTGYGGHSEVWETAVSSLDNDDDDDHFGGGAPDNAASAAAAALQGLPPSQRPTPQLQPQPAPFTTNANHAHLASHAGGLPPSNYLDSAYTQLGPDHLPQRGLPSSGLPPARSSLPYRPSLPPATTPPPSLHDERVAHSIIASAGLPLSMPSLADYIRDGQPNLVGGLPYATDGPRNYPNLSEPPPSDMIEGDYHHAPMYGGYTASTRGFSGGRGQQARGPLRYRGDGAGYGAPDPSGEADLAGGAGFAGGGGWNVQGAPNAAYGLHRPPPGVFGARLAAPAAGGVPPFAVPVVGGYPPHRPKGESEILSDLLHFHANFFPPPPPPRAPPAARRSRAELWYHYASKWDITHRLPPPPRTPLPEMELEYRLRLPKMTRVPYHGDGWLQMSEGWFDVMQSLFDYPEANVGVPVDFKLVLEHAVTG